MSGLAASQTLGVVWPFGQKLDSAGPGLPVLAYSSVVAPAAPRDLAGEAGVDAEDRPPFTPTIPNAGFDGVGRAALGVRDVVAAGRAWGRRRRRHRPAWPARRLRRSLTGGAAAAVPAAVSTRPSASSAGEDAARTGNEHEQSMPLGRWGPEPYPRSRRMSVTGLKHRCRATPALHAIGRVGAARWCVGATRPPDASLPRHADRPPPAARRGSRPARQPRQRRRPAAARRVPRPDDR